MLQAVVAIVLSASPQPQKVALFPLSPGAGVAAAVAQSLTDAFAGELRKLPGYQLLTQQELTAVLGVERQRQLAGCAESACMTEVASALDVDAVVTGSLARLGQSWLLQVQLVDARKGVTKAHASRRKKSAEIDDLLDELPSVAKELFGGTAAAATARSEPSVTTPVASAPAVDLPSPAQDVPTAVSAEQKKKLLLLKDAANRYIAIEPFAGTGGGFFYGSNASKLHAQRVFGGGSSGTESFNLVFWEPRARSPAEASFDFREGKYLLSCGKKQIEFKPVPAKQARAALDKASFYEARWRRRAYALTRDDEGTYFYVDQARVPDENQDFRVYLGSSGQLRPVGTEVIANDAAGDIFRAGPGKLKLQPRTGEAQWVAGQDTIKLTLLPVEDHARFIYTQLGAYKGLELGTPCDGHL